MFSENLLIFKGGIHEIFGILKQFPVRLHPELWD